MSCCQTETCECSRPHDQTAVQLIRSATIKVSFGDVTFLIDPMLSPKGSFPGFPMTLNHEVRNPTCDLPMPVEEAMQADVVILTHTHEDHWDETARRLLPKEKLIVVNNEQSRQEVMAAGFTNVRVLQDGDVIHGVTLHPVAGQHGPDSFYESDQIEMIKMLGETIGVVLEKPGFAPVYVAGDTVWRPAVTQAIRHYHPEVIVLNTGAAMSSVIDGSIIMESHDFLHAYQEAPWAKVVAVHMDAVNHCTLHRADLRQYRDYMKMDAKRALIPEDGEVMVFAA